MKKKQLIIGIVIVVVASILFAFGTTGITSGLKSTKEASKEKESIIGQWVDNTNVNIEFTNKGVFKMFGDDLATYTLDSKTKTVKIKYAEAYGQETNMSYGIDGNKLTMKDVATGETHTYTKK